MLLPVSDARNMIVESARSFGTESVFLTDAFRRILAEDVFADRDYPPFNRSAMDGYALRFRDFEKYKEFTLVAEMLAGEQKKILFEEGTCIKIMTGAPVPDGADVVIRVEDSEVLGNKVIFKVQQLKIWQNIALQGEDARKDDLAIKKSTIINANVTGLLASLGKSKVKVYKKPKVAIISTGNEIRRVDEEVLPHQIRDSNSHTLTFFFQHYGIDVISRNLVSDNKDDIKKALESLSEMDIIILSGGVSMGDADFVPEVLAEVGVEKRFHKVQIKPGKPLWYGIKENRCAVFALPGNPVSCQVAFKVFIEPYLRACLGLNPLQTLRLPIAGPKKKKTPFDEYFPCTFVTLESQTAVEQVKNNGSGDFTSITRSIGLAIHPANLNEISTGEILEFIPWETLF